MSVEPDLDLNFRLTKQTPLRYNLPMSSPLLTTKLYIPPPRPRLIERLNAGLHRKLTPMRSIGFIIRPGGFWQDHTVERMRDRAQAGVTVPGQPLSISTHSPSFRPPLVITRPALSRVEGWTWGLKPRSRPPVWTV